MDEAAATPADRYGASYSLYGDVDVDALLSVVRPWAPFRAWRKGDPVAGGRVATTAGVTIEIGEDHDRLEPAILRFLLEERPFLAAAARHVSHDVRSVLTCRMGVDANVASRVLLSPAALTQLAAARVELEVVGYRCADRPNP